MENLLPIETFCTTGRALMLVLLVISCLAGFSGVVNLLRQRPIWARSTGVLLAAASLVFLAGFILICWFHYRIYTGFALELPENLAVWLNRKLAAMNSGAAYSLPLYDPSAPPRYTVPLWIENEKYYFWFMCYSLMALVAHRRIKLHRFRALLHISLAIHVIILFVAVDPFGSPLPRFFEEINLWADSAGSAMGRLQLFMRMYPRMIFYYNAGYMWVHPPMLFLSYACITLTFLTSVLMLFRRDSAVELTGYGYAKFGYLLLTLGMLVGYPWALKAWGPNWWWDPKICSSIMLWSFYSTFLHTRLYVNRSGMWYFTASLGIICFLSMIFTLLSSYYFPGEHTLQ